MAKQKWYRFPLYLLARSIATCLSVLPRNVLLVLASWIGTASYYGVSRQRIKTLENLRRAFGREKSESEIRRIARGVFKNFAMTAGENLQLASWKIEKIQKHVDVTNVIETYRELLKEGRGVVFITAHIGNWELSGGVIIQHGLRGAAMARRIYFEPYNEWIVNLRLKIGVQTIYRDSSSREVLKRLARNEIVGLVPDQDLAGTKGIFVPFFGTPAFTPIAPVRLAMAAKAPMLINFLVWEKGFRYRFILGGVLRPSEDSDSEGAVKKYTEAWMQMCENVIREYPDQWGWMHDRWKTRPEDIQSHLKEKAKVNL